MRTPETIIISRTDSIGDVVLTLPVAGMLRKQFPGAKIIFMGRRYTQAVIECCVNVDEFLDYDLIEKLPLKEGVQKLKGTGADTIIHVFPRPAIAKLASKAGIKNRIGTTGRIYHWLTCNKLVAMSRKRSDLHEAQLNLKLLKPFGVIEIPELSEIPALYGFSKFSQTAPANIPMPDEKKINIILHPGSRGSGREWGLENFIRLASLLNNPRYKVFISGTKEEGSRYTELLKQNPHVENICGLPDLRQFITFISKANVLVAASTGPLHLAAASGIHALGLYAPMRPIHPGRWAPIGKKATYFVLDKACSDCRVSNDCHCMREITPEEIATYISNATTKFG